MHEVIWHGRGGQGVVVAAQALAEAAYREGFKGVTSAPTFGPERRGAPLTASTRISESPIRIFSQIDKADTIVVIDETIFSVVDITSQSKDGGLIIINTHLGADKFCIDSRFKTATVDAVGIAVKNYLMKDGFPVFNTPMLGAFAKITGLVSLENIEKALKAKLPKTAVARNFAAVKAAYEETTFGKNRCIRSDHNRNKKYG
jgi:2-oxoacid:acceptor oxidoreductase gamma subunit (pyruvate/2-ketoisovalerate family)